MNKENKDLIYYNALNNISQLGARRIPVLLQYFDSAENAWNASLDELKTVLGLPDGCEQLQKERLKIDPDKHWSELHIKGISCISPSCPEYPSLLKQIPHPPFLYYRGSLKGTEKPSVAIVGSRRCTFYGREAAHKLASELTEDGISIVSGMALGVDTAAHKGALEKNGYTVAVLGCGVDICYPRNNKDLMEQIASSGAVISEFVPGTAPLPANFPQRNRIISGLSLGTVVVEATAKSGSLITANLALEQNREVFAVPGNIGSPYSRGSHRLIKEGARLVESAADIMEELQPGLPGSDDSGQQLEMEFIESSLTKEEKSLLNIMPYQPIHIDKIIQESNSKASEVTATLLSLELKKTIRQTPGKYFSRI
ncbi:MAG: DNA-processing protein DprA [Bacillota bacterium]